MVSCRSCGRNITSGTIRCSQCSSPYHLSCSHRYKISPEGIFNVCCGNQNFFNTEPQPLLRTTRNNKRRQQQFQQQKQQQQQQRKQPGGNDDEGSMRYGKVQKTQLGMGVSKEPVADQNDGEVQEIINENDSDNIYEINQTEEESTESPNNTSIQSIPQISNMSDKITLETVWEGISALQSSISNISNSLDTVSTQLNTFDPRINDLESTLNTIKAKTTNFEMVQSDVSELKDQLTRVTSELENLKSTTPKESTTDLSQIFVEIKEREMKSRNILIYNVAEDNLRISQDYSTLEDINKFNALVSARDKSRAKEILSCIPNIELEAIQTRRLGRVRPNFCRPLRVILFSRDDVITVMKNRNLVDSKYTVKTDLTKYQQKRIKELKEELEKNTGGGVQTMTIKFINGEPQIIPVNRQPHLMKRE